MDRHELQHHAATVREEIEGISNMLKLLARETGAAEVLEIPEESIPRAFEMECVRCVLCPSASSGVIADRKVEFLNAVFERTATAQEWKRFTEEKRACPNGSQNKLPLVFAIALYNDEWFKAHGKEFPRSVVDTLLLAFLSIRGITDSAYEETSRQEREEFIDYLNGIRAQASEVRPIYRKMVLLSLQ